jgi:Mce-associated membrane protein
MSDSESTEIVDEVEAEVVDEVGAEIEADAEVVPAVVTPKPNPVTRAVTWCRQHLVATVAVGLVLASAIAAASVYWWLYRPDRLTDAASRQEVVSAAKEGTEALLSYSPENLDADLANAKSHLTGDFLSYYTDFTDKVVAPASRDKGVKTEANVARAAVSQMRPGHADVLVFVNQVTTSKERPTPALSTSSVMVTLVESGGHWLISGFNPV